MFILFLLRLFLRRKVWGLEVFFDIEVCKKFEEDGVVIGNFMRFYREKFIGDFKSVC